MDKGNHSVTDRRRMRVVYLEFALLIFGIAAWPALGQELKQASSTLSAKISESGRKRVAVVDFTDLQNNVSELGRYLAEELSGALAEEARGFRVVDRAHLKAILQEHKLASTGLIDPQTARQLGRFAGVDTLVTGTITSAFGDTVRVSIKALDSETAEIIAQSRVDVPKTKAIDELLQHSIGIATTEPTNSDTSIPQPAQATTKPSTMKVEEDRFLFEFKCSRSGQSVVCSGTVTNKAPQTRSLCPRDAYFIDNLGNRYEATEARSHPKQHDEAIVREAFYQAPSAGPSMPCLFGLELNLPIKTSFSAKGVDTVARALTYVATFDWIDGSRRPIPAFRVGVPQGDFKITVRNIPINQ